MAIKNKDINASVGIILLMLLGSTSIASAVIDCGGKAFHCVNTTHFMICVDFGGGVSTTVNDYIVTCPPATECRNNNYFECEYPAPTTLAAIVVSSDVTNEVSLKDSASASNLLWEEKVTTDLPQARTSQLTTLNTVSSITLTGVSIATDVVPIVSDSGVTNHSVSNFTSLSSNNTLDIHKLQLYNDDTKITTVSEALQPSTTSINLIEGFNFTEIGHIKFTLNGTEKNTNNSADLIEHRNVTTVTILTTERPSTEQVIFYSKTNYNFSDIATEISTLNENIDTSGLLPDLNTQLSKQNSTTTEYVTLPSNYIKEINTVSDFNNNVTEVFTSDIKDFDVVSSTRSSTLLPEETNSQYNAYVNTENSLKATAIMNTDNVVISSTSAVGDNKLVSNNDLNISTALTQIQGTTKRISNDNINDPFEQTLIINSTEDNQISTATFTENTTPHSIDKSILTSTININLNYDLPKKPLNYESTQIDSTISTLISETVFNTSKQLDELTTTISMHEDNIIFNKSLQTGNSKILSNEKFTNPLVYEILNGTSDPKQLSSTQIYSSETNSLDFNSDSTEAGILNVPMQTEEISLTTVIDVASTTNVLEGEISNKTYNPEHSSPEILNASDSINPVQNILLSTTTQTEVPNLLENTELNKTKQTENYTATTLGGVATSTEAGILNVPMQTEEISLTTVIDVASTTNALGEISNKTDNPEHSSPEILNSSNSIIPVQNILLSTVTQTEVPNLLENTELNKIKQIETYTATTLDGVPTSTESGILNVPMQAEEISLTTVIDVASTTNALEGEISNKTDNPEHSSPEILNSSNSINPVQNILRNTTIQTEGPNLLENTELNKTKHIENYTATTLDGIPTSTEAGILNVPKQTEEISLTTVIDVASTTNALGKISNKTDNSEHSSPEILNSSNSIIPVQNILLSTATQTEVPNLLENTELNKTKQIETYTATTLDGVPTSAESGILNVPMQTEEISLTTVIDVASTTNALGEISNKTDNLEHSSPDIFNSSNSINPVQIILLNTTAKTEVLNLLEDTELNKTKQIENYTATTLGGVATSTEAGILNVPMQTEELSLTTVIDVASTTNAIEGKISNKTDNPEHSSPEILNSSNSINPVQNILRNTTIQTEGPNLLENTELNKTKHIENYTATTLDGIPTSTEAGILNVPMQTEEISLTTVIDVASTTNALGEISNKTDNSEHSSPEILNSSNSIIPVQNILLSTATQTEVPNLLENTELNKTKQIETYTATTLDGVPTSTESGILNVPMQAEEISLTTVIDVASTTNALGEISNKTDNLEHSSPDIFNSSNSINPVQIILLNTTAKTEVLNLLEDTELNKTKQIENYTATTLGGVATSTEAGILNVPMQTEELSLTTVIDVASTTNAIEGEISNKTDNHEHSSPEILNSSNSINPIQNILRNTTIQTEGPNLLENIELNKTEQIETYTATTLDGVPTSTESGILNVPMQTEEISLTTVIEVASTTNALESEISNKTDNPEHSSPEILNSSNSIKPEPNILLNTTTHTEVPNLLENTKLNKTKHTENYTATTLDGVPTSTESGILNVPLKTEEISLTTVIDVATTTNTLESEISNKTDNPEHSSPEILNSSNSIKPEPNILLNTTTHTEVPNLLENTKLNKTEQIETYTATTLDGVPTSTESGILNVPMQTEEISLTTVIDVASTTNALEGEISNKTDNPEHSSPEILNSSNSINPEPNILLNTTTQTEVPTLLENTNLNKTKQIETYTATTLDGVPTSAESGILNVPMQTEEISLTTVIDVASTTNALEGEISNKTDNSEHSSPEILNSSNSINPEPNILWNTTTQTEVPTLLENTNLNKTKQIETYTATTLDGVPTSTESGILNVPMQAEEISLTTVIDVASTTNALEGEISNKTDNPEHSSPEILNSSNSINPVQNILRNTTIQTEGPNLLENTELNKTKHIENYTATTLDGIPTSTEAGILNVPMQTEEISLTTVIDVASTTNALGEISNKTDNSEHSSPEILNSSNSIIPVQNILLSTVTQTEVPNLLENTELNKTKQIETYTATTLDGVPTSTESGILNVPMQAEEISLTTVIDVASTTNALGEISNKTDNLEHSSPDIFNSSNSINPVQIILLNTTAKTEVLNLLEDTELNKTKQIENYTATTLGGVATSTEAGILNVPMQTEELSLTTVIDVASTTNALEGKISNKTDNPEHSSPEILNSSNSINPEPNILLNTTTHTEVPNLLENTKLNKTEQIETYTATTLDGVPTSTESGILNVPMQTEEISLTTVIDVASTTNALGEISNKTDNLEHSSPDIFNSSNSINPVQIILLNTTAKTEVLNLLEDTELNKTKQIENYTATTLGGVATSTEAGILNVPMQTEELSLTTFIDVASTTNTLESEISNKTDNHEHSSPGILNSSNSINPVQNILRNTTIQTEGPNLLENIELNKTEQIETYTATTLDGVPTSTESGILNVPMQTEEISLTTVIEVASTTNALESEISNKTDNPEHSSPEILNSSNSIKPEPNILLNTTTHTEVPNLLENTELNKTKQIETYTATTLDGVPTSTESGILNVPMQAEEISLTTVIDVASTTNALESEISNKTDNPEHSSPEILNSSNSIKPEPNILLNTTTHTEVPTLLENTNLNKTKQIETYTATTLDGVPTSAESGILNVPMQTEEISLTTVIDVASTTNALEGEISNKTDNSEHSSPEILNSSNSINPEPNILLNTTTHTEVPNLLENTKLNKTEQIETYTATTLDGVPTSTESGILNVPMQTEEISLTTVIDVASTTNALGEISNKTDNLEHSSPDIFNSSNSINPVQIILLNTTAKTEVLNLLEDTELNKTKQIENYTATTLGGVATSTEAGILNVPMQTEELSLTTFIDVASTTNTLESEISNKTDNHEHSSPEILNSSNSINPVQNILRNTTIQTEGPNLLENIELNKTEQIETYTATTLDGVPTSTESGILNVPMQTEEISLTTVIEVASTTNALESEISNKTDNPEHSSPEILNSSNSIKPEPNILLNTTTQTEVPNLLEITKLNKTKQIETYTATTLDGVPTSAESGILNVPMQTEEISLTTVIDVASTTNALEGEISNKTDNPEHSSPEILNSSNSINPEPNILLNTTTHTEIPNLLENTKLNKTEQIETYTATTLDGVPTSTESGILNVPMQTEEISLTTVIDVASTTNALGEISNKTDNLEHSSPDIFNSSNSINPVQIILLNTTAKTEVLNLLEDTELNKTKQIENYTATTLGGVATSTEAGILNVPMQTEELSLTTFIDVASTTNTLESEISNKTDNHEHSSPEILNSSNSINPVQNILRNTTIQTEGPNLLENIELNKTEQIETYTATTLDGVPTSTESGILNVPMQTEEISLTTVIEVASTTNALESEISNKTDNPEHSSPEILNSSNSIKPEPNILLNTTTQTEVPNLLEITKLNKTKQIETYTATTLDGVPTSAESGILNVPMQTEEISLTTVIDVASTTNALEGEISNKTDNPEHSSPEILNSSNSINPEPNILLNTTTHTEIPNLLENTKLNKTEQIETYTATTLDGVPTSTESGILNVPMQTEEISLTTVIDVASTTNALESEISNKTDNPEHSSPGSMMMRNNPLHSTIDVGSSFNLLETKILNKSTQTDKLSTIIGFQTETITNSLKNIVSNTAIQIEPLTTISYTDKTSDFIKNIEVNKSKHNKPTSTTLGVNPTSNPLQTGILTELRQINGFSLSTARNVETTNLLKNEILYKISKEPFSTTLNVNITSDSLNNISLKKLTQTEESLLTATEDANKVFKTGVLLNKPKLIKEYSIPENEINKPLPTESNSTSSTNTTKLITDTTTTSSLRPNSSPYESPQMQALTTNSSRNVIINISETTLSNESIQSDLLSSVKILDAKSLNHSLVKVQNKSSLVETSLTSMFSVETTTETKSFETPTLSYHPQQIVVSTYSTYIEVPQVTSSLTKNDSHSIIDTSVDTTVKIAESIDNVQSTYPERSKSLNGLDTISKSNGVDSVKNIISEESKYNNKTINMATSHINDKDDLSDNNKLQFDTKNISTAENDNADENNKNLTLESKSSYTSDTFTVNVANKSSLYVQNSMPLLTTVSTTLSTTYLTTKTDTLTKRIPNILKEHTHDPAHTESTQTLGNQTSQLTTNGFHKDRNHKNKNRAHNLQNNENAQFNCRHHNRGRYADQNDCKKFYVCIGKQKPIIGVCPDNTVFSNIRKQCTKNVSHCIRKNQFQCVSAGKFRDFLNENVYYICIRNMHGAFVRFKFQCQRGYYLNKNTVKCIHNSDVTNRSVSNSSRKDSEKTIEKDSNEERSNSQENIFECENEGKFSDPTDCRIYYICSKNKKSTFRRRRKKCDSDEIFHKDKKKCVDNESNECGST